MPPRRASRRPNTSDGTTPTTPGGSFGHFFSTTKAIGAAVTSPLRDGQVSFTRDSPAKAHKTPSSPPPKVLSSAVASFASFSTPGGMHITNPSSYTSWAKTPPLAPTTKTRPAVITSAGAASYSNSLSSLTTDVTSDPPTSSVSSEPPLQLPPPRSQYFIEKRRKKHHAYGKNVPYTASYERFVTDQ